MHRKKTLPPKMKTLNCLSYFSFLSPTKRNTLFRAPAQYIIMLYKLNITASELLKLKYLNSVKKVLIVTQALIDY
jgi:hypothetical protein